MTEQAGFGPQLPPKPQIEVVLGVVGVPSCAHDFDPDARKLRPLPRWKRQLQESRQDEQHSQHREAVDGVHSRLDEQRMRVSRVKLYRDLVIADRYRRQDAGDDETDRRERKVVGSTRHLSSEASG